VRAEGAQGPEWTLLPCGDQFYRLRFEARETLDQASGVHVEITKIIDDFEMTTRRPA
jgi:hypothetical protein